jgi:hypothetical protein
MNYTASQRSQSLFQLPRRCCRRDRFAVFVKVLLKALKDSGDFALLGSVKQIILVCTRRNQAGDPNFTPLAETTSRLLQYVVGQAQWQRAERLLVMKIAVVVQEQERDERRKSNAFNEAVQACMANLTLVLLKVQRSTPPLVDASGRVCVVVPRTICPIVVNSGRNQPPR